jgi:carbon monoxide dehydrogenase subunit G
VSINVSETIKAPPEKVFSFLSDFEKAPQYSSYWKSVKSVKREGNSVTYETEAEAEGRKIKSVTKMTGQPSQRLDAETVDGDGKGTRMSFVLAGLPDGTQLTLQGEIVLPGFAKLLGGVVKGRIESGMKEELRIIKKALEH